MLLHIQCASHDSFKHYYNVNIRPPTTPCLIPQSQTLAQQPSSSSTHSSGSCTDTPTQLPENFSYKRSCRVSILLLNRLAAHDPPHYLRLLRLLVSNISWCATKGSRSGEALNFVRPTFLFAFNMVLQQHLIQKRFNQVRRWKWGRFSKK